MTKQSKCATKPTHQDRKTKGKLITRIKHEPVTQCICHKGFSGNSSILPPHKHWCNLTGKYPAIPYGTHTQTLCVMLKIKKTNMKKIIESYFKANNWAVLTVLIAIYAIALTIEFNYVFTDDFYISSFESKLSPESIDNLIIKERGSQWINYPIVILIVIIPASLIAFCLNIGAVLKNYKVAFSKLFGITLKAQLIFALNYLLAVILKSTGIVDFTYSTVNNNYKFQSLLIFFDTKTLPYWLSYPLQCINIAEGLHILFLALGISLLLDKKYSKSLTFVLFWYGMGLLFWIVFSVFLQTVLYV